MARDNRNLGTFKLDGIRPAMRGIPQIEVTFDIDANGILNVSAKDKDTAKEQKITISGSTNLDKGDVDRMVQEAKDHAAEDRKRREEADAKNHLESAAYQVEKLLADLGDKAPVHEKARAEQAVADAKALLKDESASIDRVKSLTSDLQQVAQGLAQAASTQQQAPEAAQESGPSQAPGGDDVIDADFKQN